MKRCVHWLAILLLAQGPVSALAAGDVPPGWDAALADGHAVRISAEPLQLTGGELSGLVQRGAWVLKGDRPEFGGLSGLLIRGGKLFAVSDRGWWLGADISDIAGEPVLTNARMAPILDPQGRAYDKSGGDAEGLAWDVTAEGVDRLAISFERDHRIMRLGADGTVSDPIAPEIFDRLHRNRGIEALAQLPGGGLIALAEGRDGDFAPVFVLRPDGGIVEAGLHMTWLHSVTGADLGPDGKLYLLLREYSALFGISIRVMRYSLAGDGVPVPESAETLAAYEAASGIDNMEGIALEARPDGPTRLWLISDDNFRGTQRTVLVAFDVQP